MLKRIITLGAGVAVGYILAQKVAQKTEKMSDNKSRPHQLQMNVIKKSAYTKNINRLKDLAEERQEISNRDVVAELGVSQKTARNYCNELVKRGSLQKIGSTGRGVKFIVKK